MRFRLAFLSVLLVATAACDSERPESAASADDRAIADVVLKDFSEWKQATFGEQVGVLAITPSSIARIDLTPERVKALAPRIRLLVSDELANSFAQRNKVAAPIEAIVANSPWAKVQDATNPNPDPRDLPSGIKATGSITWPGTSADGTSALIQLLHTWSIHGAIVTYVLAKRNGAWRIVARDQTVFP